MPARQTRSQQILAQTTGQASNLVLLCNESVPNRSNRLRAASGLRDPSERRARGPDAGEPRPQLPRLGQPAGEANVAVGPHRQQTVAGPASDPMQPDEGA